VNGRPNILVAFGGRGGSSEGYNRAGFDPVGIDLECDPANPYPTIIGDALATLDTLLAGDPVHDNRGRYWFLSDFAAVHASPPCQRFSVLAKRWGNAEDHPDLLDATRDRLEAAGLPWVIENVVGAPLRDPVKLCGSMFDLPVERHRLFESNIAIPQPCCDHARQAELWPDGFPALRSGREGKRARVVGVFGNGGGANKDLATWRWAMDLPHASKRTLALTIPPAYTHHIGNAFKEAIA
jgi:DNA (cytosine-5)-methyltransferase 1